MRLHALHAATAIALAATASLTMPTSSVRVIDGDTLRIGDERVRIAGIDTPGAACGCQKACEIAEAARSRLSEILASGQVSVSRKGDDKLRRGLADVRVDGRDVGDLLVAEGLARRAGLRRAGWCQSAEAK